MNRVQQEVLIVLQVNKIIHKYMKTVYFLWNFWDTTPISSKLFRNIITWHNNNPNYSIQILNKANCDVQMSECMTWNEIYLSYTLPIQQCDFYRYFLIFRNGGFYSDIDVVSNLNLDNLKKLFPTKTLFLCTEKVLTSEEQDKTKLYKQRKNIAENKIRISNYFFGCIKKKHKFWKYVLKYCKQRKNTNVIEDYDIIFSTGPDIITTAYFEYIKNNPNNDICLLDLDFCKHSLQHSCNSLHNQHSSWRKTLLHSNPEIINY